MTGQLTVKGFSTATADARWCWMIITIAVFRDEFHQMWLMIWYTTARKYPLKSYYLSPQTECSPQTRCSDPRGRLHHCSQEEITPELTAARSKRKKNSGTLSSTPRDDEVVQLKSDDDDCGLGFSSAVSYVCYADCRLSLLLPDAVVGASVWPSRASRRRVL